MFRLDMNKRLVIGGCVDRMRVVEVGGKYIPVPDLQNLGAMGEIHSHFDRRIISQGTDHAT